MFDLAEDFLGADIHRALIRIIIMRNFFYSGIFLIFFGIVQAAHAQNTSSVPVLIYHEIVTGDREPGEVVIHADLFKRQMDYLAQEGYTTLSMDELISFMKGKKDIPQKSVVLNFDDGWKNVLNAVPILDQYHFKASFWVIAGDWFGPDYLDWTQIQELDQHPNFEVQSHTVTHPWKKDSNLLTWLKGQPQGK